MKMRPNYENKADKSQIPQFQLITVSVELPNIVANGSSGNINYDPSSQIPEGYTALAVMPRWSGHTSLCWVSCILNSSGLGTVLLRNVSSNAINGAIAQVYILCIKR